MHSTLECLELVTTGCCWSGSTIAVHMFMALLLFADAPDIAKALTSSDVCVKELICHTNKTVSTINPAVRLDGSDIESAPTHLQQS